MDILDILKKYDITVPEEKLGDLNKDLRVNFKSAAEVKKIKDDLAAAQAKIDSSVDFEGKYNTLQKKYNDDIAAKQAEIDGLNFDTKLNTALRGIEFASDRIRNSVVAEIKAKSFKVDEAGNLEGLNDYLKNLYNTEPDTFKQVDSGIHTWYGGSQDNPNNNKQPTKEFDYKIF